MAYISTILALYCLSLVPILGTVIGLFLRYGGVHPHTKKVGRNCLLLSALPVALSFLISAISEVGDQIRHSGELYIDHSSVSRDAGVE